MKTLVLSDEDYLALLRLLVVAKYDRESLNIAGGFGESDDHIRALVTMHDTLVAAAQTEQAPKQEEQP